jgi:hypothetical protein
MWNFTFLRLPFVEVTQSVNLKICMQLTGIMSVIHIQPHWDAYSAHVDNVFTHFLSSKIYFFLRTPNVRV